MDKASEAILALEPVTFHYKSDNNGASSIRFLEREESCRAPSLTRDRRKEKSKKPTLEET
jgi:hypothetical protein